MITTNCTRLAATQRGHLQRDISELGLIDQTNAMAKQLADALYKLICPHDDQMRYAEVSRESKTASFAIEQNSQLAFWSISHVCS